MNKEPNEDLYVVLIADSRTVLFLFQTKTDTVSYVEYAANILLWGFNKKYFTSTTEVESGKGASNT